jgi:hypothetical protein
MSGLEFRFITSEAVAVSTSLALADLHEVVEGFPVRRVPSYRNQKHYPGWFWSATTGDHVRYESRLELDRMWLADFDPDVVSFAAQPFHLSGSLDGLYHSHTPDLLLKHRGGSFTVVDVKPAEYAARPEVAEVFEWTARACVSRGWVYEVWSSAPAALLANVRYLGGFRRQWLLPAGAVSSARAELTPSDTIGSLASRLGYGGRAAVLAGLWHGVLKTDLRVLLSAGSPLTAGGRGEK